MQTGSFWMRVARDATTLRVMAGDRLVRLLFVVTALLFLPLDFTQLAFAVSGACLYTFLQHVSERGDWWPSKKKVKGSGKPALKAWPPSLPKECWEADVQLLLAQITPTAGSEKAMERIVETVREAIQPIFPDAEVMGFVSGELEGSRAFRVAVPDVELVVSIPPGQLRQKLLGKLEKKLDKQLEKAAIRCIAETLVSSCGFKFRRSAFRGEEPKLTLLSPHFQGEAVPLDVAVNAETPLYQAALHKECAQRDVRATQLILLVRRWAKDRGICHAAKGYPLPYHWSLLVIFFLQVHPAQVLPPLTAFTAYQRLVPTATATSSEKSSDGVHISKLLKDFMHFYRDFQWRKELINPITGVRGPTTYEDGCLSLQDPFRAGNLGNRVLPLSFQRMCWEFKRAAEICDENVGPERMFELWVPPQAEKRGEQERYPQLEVPDADPYVKL